MYIPQPVIPMYMTILAQTIKLDIQFVSFYEWVFMYMYLRINIVAYWLLLIYSVSMQDSSQTQKWGFKTWLDLSALRLGILETLLPKDLTWDWKTFKSCVLDKWKINNAQARKKANFSWQMKQLEYLPIESNEENSMYILMVSIQRPGKPALKDLRPDLLG